MRIVSLLPSATEIACALGLRESLVAVSHACDHPASVAPLPRITRSILPPGLSDAEIDARVSAAARAGASLYTVDADLLRDLRPDLILTQGVCEVCAVSVDTVQTAMGDLPRDVAEAAQVLSLEGTSVQGVLDDILALGRAAGVEARATALVAALTDGWLSLQAATAEAPAPRPQVMMLEWADPPFSGGHWVPEQVLAAGGDSAIGAPGQDSRRLSWAEIQAADPDLLCVIACGAGLEANTALARQLYDHPEARALRAVQQGQVWAFDANSYFSRPAPRLIEGAALLREALLEGRARSGASERVPRP